jgi:large subunit ribosomal protein L13
MMRGKKKVKKVFRYHTGYIGHMREIKYANFMEDKPEQIVRFLNCRLRGV